jgi:hypothetical protein
VATTGRAALIASRMVIDAASVIEVRANTSHAASSAGISRR